jgi:hypothetical protein
MSSAKYNNLVIKRVGDRIEFKVDVWMGDWHWVSNRTGNACYMPELDALCSTDLLDQAKCAQAMTAMILRERERRNEKAFNADAESKRVPKRHS